MFCFFFCCSLESTFTSRQSLALETLNLTPKTNMGLITSGSVNHLWTKHSRWDSGQRMSYGRSNLVYSYVLCRVADLFLYLVSMACRMFLFCCCFYFSPRDGAHGLFFFLHVFLCAPVVLDLPCCKGFSTH